MDIGIFEVSIKDFPWEDVRSWPDNCVDSWKGDVKEADGDYFAWFVKVDGKVVAYLVYEEERVKRIHIYYVETRRDFQRKKLATALFEKLRDKYQGRYDFIAFSTSGRAEQLLAKWGFQERGKGFWILPKQKQD